MPLRFEFTVVPPLIRLYVSPIIGELTVTDPCWVQVGCVAVIAGDEDNVGAAIMVTLLEAREVPHALNAVTVYVPDVTFGKLPVRLVFTVLPPLTRL